MSWRVYGLHVRLAGTDVLGGIDLPITQGSITAVVGGDGAGKTTVLRTLVGLAPVSAGRVSVPDRRRIGYMPSSSGVYPDLTVDENLAFASTAYGVPRPEATRRRDAYVEAAGLATARDRLASKLSGGMRQKLGAIRAMMHAPDLLVLDEPTTGVDPVSRAELWRLLQRVAADGAAVVFATTYLDEASRATTLLVLDEGRTLAAGKPTDVIDAIPGAIGSYDRRPAAGGLRVWRRGARWRAWGPSSSGDGNVVRADLHDAVMVAAIQKRERADTRGGLAS